MTDLRNVKIKYNHWLGRPFPFKVKNGRVYARTIGYTIYFFNPKEVMLQLNDHGDRLKHHKLFRHELQHVYDCKEIGKIKFPILYWLEVIKILITSFSLRKAYINNKYELKAREYSKTPLTVKEWNFIFKDQEEMIRAQESNTN